MDKVLGVDLSRWQPVVDWPTLAKGGVGFAIAKASQGTTTKDPLLRSHFFKAKEVDLLVGAYHWCDPTMKPDDQVENFFEAMDGMAFDFLALDVEQYWQSWQEWLEGKITRFVKPDTISSVALSMAREIRTRSSIPLLLYTRKSFILDYARPMLQWIADWPLWLAYYPYASGRKAVSWETLVQDCLPKVVGPSLPEGCMDWTFWQFSGDKFILPGATTALDLDYFNGSLEDLRKWCGAQPVDSNQLPVTGEEMIRILWEAHPELHSVAV
jgi:lysozyme